MKTRCIYCGHTYDDAEMNCCPACSETNNLTGLSEEQIHHLHQSCHNQIRKYTGIKDNGLTFLVIGSILLVIGSVFLFLSFRYNTLHVRVFTPGSTEFVVSVLALALSLSSIVFGVVRIIIGATRIKANKKLIAETELKK